MQSYAIIHARTYVISALVALAISEPCSPDAKYRSGFPLQPM